MGMGQQVGNGSSVCVNMCVCVNMRVCVTVRDVSRSCFLVGAGKRDMPTVAGSRQ